MFSLCSFYLCQPLTATALSPLQQLYLEAERGLKKKNRRAFVKHQAQLRQYPLYPYLLARDYRLRMHRIDADELRQFLAQHPNTVFAERLRVAWLYHLKNRLRWEEFAALYRSSALFPDKDLACYYGRSLMYQDDIDALEAQLKKLWLVGFSQPPACDRVFQWAFEHELIDDDLIWQRILLSFPKQPKLADYLAKKLSQQYKQWYRLLKQARSNPQAALHKLQNHHQLRDNKAVRDVATYAILRLGRKQAQQMLRLWEQLSVHYVPAERYSVQKRLATQQLHYLRTELAYQLFADTPSWNHDIESQRAQVRAAIHLGEPHKLTTALAALPPTEREKPQWRYWQAHYLLLSNKHEAGRAILRDLAQRANYYGFLAADRLGQAYQLKSKPVRATQSELNAMLKNPRVKRMRELIALGKQVEARREFFMLATVFTPQQYSHLAVLTERWAWYDGTIRAIAKSNIEDETHLRFPHCLS